MGCFTGCFSGDGQKRGGGPRGKRDAKAKKSGKNLKLVSGASERQGKEPTRSSRGKVEKGTTCVSDAILHSLDHLSSTVHGTPFPFAFTWGPRAPRSVHLTSSRPRDVQGIQLTSITDHSQNNPPIPPVRFPLPISPPPPYFLCLSLSPLFLSPFLDGEKKKKNAAPDILVSMN